MDYRLARWEAALEIIATIATCSGTKTPVCRGHVCLLFDLDLQLYLD